MGKARGIIDWFKTCPLVEDVEEFDINQLSAQEMMAGLYKQPAVTTEKLIDGTVIVTENYYVLFRRAAKVKADRYENDDFMEAVENWVYEQELAENYPDIGFDVFEIEATNAFYMLERDSDDAVYQLTISIKFMKEAKND